MARDTSRYELVTRRAMLKRAAVVGTLAFVPGLACSSSDEDTFATSTTTAPSPTTAGAPTTTKAAATTTTAATATGPVFPANGQLVVKFSFTPTGGGRINNPFVAVWIEDASGTLVRTVALWMKPSEAKYVNELKRWYTVDRSRIAKGGKDTMLTISGPTKVAGAYSVNWDGRNDAGTPVAQGDYFVCIEAAREHGPYELIREQITIAGGAFTKALTDNGELTAASVALGV